jgi:hypothetical protein
VRLRSDLTRRGVVRTGTALLTSGVLSAVAFAQAPASLTCSPSVIAGGSAGTSTCTVTLTGAAPAGGAAVTLTSSLVDLAASVPQVLVPAGQTTASFTVGTNPTYRPYSGLGFSVTIAATAGGTTRTAALAVTAQSRPADFNSGSQAGANTQWDGLMCGGIAPIGGRPDILYSCSPAGSSGFGTCTFAQECAAGCRRVPPDGRTFRDACATSGPNPVSVSRKVVVGGDRVPASIVAAAPAGSAPAQEQGVPRVIDPNFNSTSFPHNGIGFPDGATSVPFEVATSLVPAIQFVDVGGFWFNDAIPPFLITNGRGGHEWLVVLPPDPAPSIAIPTLGDFTITGSNPVTGGQRTIGQADLSGLSRAGGPRITVTSSHPSIVPAVTVDAPQSQQLFGFQIFIPTEAPAADTDVTVRASDGRYSFSRVLRVLKAPPPPVLADVTVNPTSVVGGNSSTGTVFLSAAQSGATTVSLSTPAPASVATMPSSITIPAGETSASFQIATSPVSSTFNMNVFADLPGNPGQQALLLINPGTAPSATLSSLSINPSSVTGGTSSTGTVALTSAAPSGGAAVSLSDNSSAASVPASVTVPAGATAANFSIATTAVSASTTATISAAFGGVARTGTLTVTSSSSPPPASGTATLTVTATGRSGERVSSSPSGIRVSVGSTQTASFTLGTSITLTVSDGRDAIWSGSCSSGGNKRRSCAFTLNGTASVTASVR